MTAANTDSAVEPVSNPYQRVQILHVDEELASQRIDNFLIKLLKGVPRSKIYRIIRKGEVRVNKSRVKPEYKLEVGDQVRVPPVRVAAAATPSRPSMSLENHLASAIVYEDAELLVIDKPSGLAVHGGSGINMGLIEALRFMRPESRYLELVHRLDRDTSGCIMVAKKRSMLRYLHAELREGRVDKRYQALVLGRWPNRRKLVNAPLQKNIMQSGERMVRVSAEGKKSLTEFTVLERFEQATLVEAKPVTGRTHQIRVHALHAGHPLLGDDKYGDPLAEQPFRAKGLNRLFLHAVSLSLTMPSGKKLVVAAPLSEDLQIFVNQLSQGS